MPRPGWAEQDPDDWWRATEQAIAALAVDEVAAIGLSGQMHGLVALDEHDRVIRPAILWNDGRTAAECAEIESRVGLERLIALTGNRALTGFTAPKLLWLRSTSRALPADRPDHAPEGLRAPAAVRRARDQMADASGTLLLDVAGRRWSDEVLEALEVDPAWLPRLLESPDVSGRTANEVAVAAGAGDQAAGALGVGVDRPGPLSIALGTSGVVFAALPAFAADAGAGARVLPCGPRRLARDGRDASAAGSLRWLRDVAAPGTGYAELVAGRPRGRPASRA